MQEYILPSVLAALGFFLGFFYTRTMKLADGIHEKYLERDECRQFRADCRRERGPGREEVLRRLQRLEDKMDRLTEMVMGEKAHDAY